MPRRSEKRTIKDDLDSAFEIAAVQGLIEPPILDDITYLYQLNSILLVSNIIDSSRYLNKRMPGQQEDCLWTQLRDILPFQMLVSLPTSAWSQTAFGGLLNCLKNMEEQNIGVRHLNMEPKLGQCLIRLLLPCIFLDLQAVQQNKCEWS